MGMGTTRGHPGELGSPNETSMMQSSSQTPHHQAAVAEMIEENLRQLPDKGGRPGRFLQVTIALVVVLGTGVLIV